MKLALRDVLDPDAKGVCAARGATGTGAIIMCSTTNPAKRGNAGNAGQKGTEGERRGDEQTFTIKLQTVRRRAISFAGIAEYFSFFRFFFALLSRPLFFSHGFRFFAAAKGFVGSFVSSSDKGGGARGGRRRRRRQLVDGNDKASGVGSDS